MPGVQTTQATLTGPSNPGPTSSRVQIVGKTEKGPLDGSRIVITNEDQFIRHYGGRTNSVGAVYDNLRSFINEEGAEAVITRVVGPNATQGEVTLLDSAGVETLRIATRDPGPHSGAYRAVVETNAGTPETFNVTVFDGASTVLAQWVQMASVAEIAEQALTQRNFVVTNLASASVGAAANPVQGDFPFAPGTDDLAAVTVADYESALARSGAQAPGGMVIAPDLPASVVGETLADHAERHDMIAGVAEGTGATRSSIVQTAQQLANLTNARYIGLFYSDLLVPQGSRKTVRTTPLGYVAAVRARAHRKYGYHANPAGLDSRARFISATVDEIDLVANEELYAANVNAVVTMRGNPDMVCLYGYRSLHADGDTFGPLQHQDTLNNIAVQMRTVLAPFVFRTNDGRGVLKAEIEGAATSVLETLRSANALWPAMQSDGIDDAGYVINVTDVPADAYGANTDEVLVDVRVRLAPSADLISVGIFKVARNAAL